MKENLYYLFISGLILGSGPCLSLCAPILVSYAAIHKKTFKDSFFSYLIFSLSKIFGYCILGVVCALGVKVIVSPLDAKYLDLLYLIIGCFIVLIGITAIFYRGKSFNPVCGWLHKGNIRNVGVLGLLIGLAPCLPLLGILNYIVLVSDSHLNVIGFCIVFGLGTVISPLFLMILLSGKLAQIFSKNDKLKIIIRILCGGIIIFLGGKIILQILLR
ncbi:MAG: sulfite exporter TauE/SafE family protein [Candidatus Omnitrophica bacterium]|nr:sulfite exporter TauE/SafE family protein [Candidatus Omnitrophota bacterium]